MPGTGTSEPPRSAAPGTPARLYLIDGSGYIFRAFHALPPMQRSDGTPTNAVHGFCSMLHRLLQRLAGGNAAIAVVFDKSGTTFRNALYPDYKAHRPDPPEKLVPQFGLIREATRAFNLPCIEMDGYEADDLIATYARIAAAAGTEVTVISSDKDLMQLVRPGVVMRDPIKDRDIGPDEVAEKFGVAPDRVVDVQALAGDSTDNVPGVPGIGIKTAAQLIGEYGDLDTLLARAGEIRQPKRRQSLVEHADMARLSRRLVTLRDDIDVPDSLADLARKEPDPEVLVGFLKAQDFNRLTARIAADLAAGAAAAAAESGEVACELVTAEAELRRWIAAAGSAGAVAVHVATASADAMSTRLAGIALAVTPGRAAYIPVGHVAPETGGEPDPGAGEASATLPEQLPAATVLAALAPVIADPAVLKIGHNLKFGLLVLARAGAAQPGREPGREPVAESLDDTMLLSHVLDAGRGGHGLDELAMRELGVATARITELTGSGRKAIPFDQVPADAAGRHAGAAAEVILRLHRSLRRRLVAERLVTVHETVERPMIPVIAGMERAGIAVDRARLAALSRDFAGRAAALEARAHALAGGEFNIGSPRQLGEILFDRMALPGARKGRTGAWTTDAGVLEDLVAAGHELPQVVLDWRHLAKLRSTYADALVKRIDPGSGRVHTAFGMAGALTGRLSSNDPNLQNIPVRTEEGRKIRAAFVAAAGYRLVSLDYSQIELRIVAHRARVEPLLEAFAAGADIHALTASQVFGVALDGLPRELRNRAKAINFGIIYGISAFGLARNLGIEVGEAQTHIAAYFEQYPGVRAYMDESVAFARAHGHVETLFGRRIHLPGIADGNPAKRAFVERQAINAPIQGSAADIIKRAMARVPAALDGAGLSGRMLLQVHDELLFEVPEAEVDDTVAAVRTVMEHAAEPALELAVPLTVDAGVGCNWDAAH